MVFLLFFHERTAETADDKGEGRDEPQRLPES
jgi:hypothetical protein